MDKTDVKQIITNRLTSISLLQKEKYSNAICNHAAKAIIKFKARNVGIFLSIKNEVYIEQIILLPQLKKINFFIPKITRGKLKFIKVDRYTNLKINKFNILEPISGKTILANELDIALTPLLACDQNGNRLGKGGGYYDRTFKKLNAVNKYKKTKLLGIAFDTQKIAEISNDPWDVKLWGLITEYGLIKY